MSIIAASDNPIIRVQDVAYCRLRVPDLDAMEAFLTDFGMVRAARTATALYMRGTDPQHHLHVTEKGEKAVVGVAFLAASAAELDKLAREAPGASPVETIDEPGGGKRVSLTDPNGYRIEVIHGMATHPAIKLDLLPINTSAEPLRRAGRTVRLTRGPAHIKRMGHFVISTPKAKETIAWYRDRLGFIGSDEFYRDAEDNIIASFNRCDRGEDYVDHHTVYFRQSNKTSIHHFSFEAQDVDDVFLGHDHMAGRGYRHVLGVSRHIVGSQIADYWSDPFGNLHEFFTDTDRLNRANGSNLGNAKGRDMSDQWGGTPSEEFAQW